MVRTAALIGLLLQAAPTSTPTPTPATNNWWDRDNVVVGLDATHSLWMIRGPDFAKRTKEGMSGWIEVDSRHDRTTRARRTMMQVSISCASRTLSIYQSISYAVDGTIVASNRDPYAHLHTDQAVPGSIGDMTISEVCDKN